MKQRLRKGNDWEEERLYYDDNDYEATEEQRQGGVIDRGRRGLLKGATQDGQGWWGQRIEMENCSQDNCGKYAKILLVIVKRVNVTGS